MSGEGEEWGCFFSEKNTLFLHLYRKQIVSDLARIFFILFSKNVL